MATTQFEVYVLEYGRWTLHARYSAHERNEAVQDAGSTDANVRLPTKVIRETYFPERNESECVTIYTSPRTKLSGRIAALPRQIRRQAFSKPERRAVRPSRNTIQEVLRILLAAAISLFLATLITVLIEPILQRLSAIDVAFDALTSSNALAFSYIGVFLLFFMWLLRSRLLLDRLLPDLWAQKPATRSAGGAVSRQPSWVDPKHSRARFSQTSEKPEEADRPHGGPDFSGSAATGSRVEVNHKVPAEAKISEPIFPPFSSGAESVTAESEPPVESQSGAEPAMPQPGSVLDSVDAASAERVEALAKGCALLRRFVHVLVKPAARVMSDETAAWRGIALVLVGAVDALVGCTPDAAVNRLALLDYALDCAGLSPNAIALFLRDGDTQVAVGSNASLVLAGATSMEAYRTAAVPDPYSLAAAFLAWCTPSGHAAAPAPETLPSIDLNASALIEVFLMTEFRPPADQNPNPQKNEAHHHAIARDALRHNRGTEVKHTGSCFFGRFSRADAAIDAAFEIQGACAGLAAIALIANSDIDADPALSPALFQRAETAVKITADGALTAEPAVHAAARLPHVRGDLLTDRQYKYGKLLRLSRVSGPVKTEATEALSGFDGFISEAAALITFDRLNAYTRFCFSLYLAGAASVIGKTERLARDAQIAMLCDGLQVAGNSMERAETFCADLPSHRKNPKYAEMIQAGAQAMSRHISGGRNAVGGLAALLNEWSLPRKRTSVPSVITFLFTDIVDSMEMTQQLGNAVAQKALRVHNAAVRAAIEASKGREVKHLGDGIMATFPDPPSAVAAAIQMQHDIAQHNAANPGLHLSVRIGVNVGEALEEDSDFFGAAVQMTARICDTATKDNIWVSQAVVDACEGQRIAFILRGHFEMKGVRDAKILYEVGWSDAHKIEIGDL